MDVESVKRMVLPELRSALRQRGLNPAGGVEALKERLTEALLSSGEGAGAPPPQAATALGEQKAPGNNYSRPGGQQNVGNFITDRPSSRVVQPPGGATSVSLFGGGGEQPQSQERARPPPPQQTEASPPPATGGPVEFEMRRNEGERLGLGVQDSEEGLLLDQPTPGTIAEASGTGQYVGSRITHVNGIPVHTMDDLAGCVQGALVVRITIDQGAVHADPEVQQSAPPVPAGGGVTNNYHRAGGQQNVGNYMTGRPTSRVLAAPGGASNISLGHGGGEEVPPAGTKTRPDGPAGSVDGSQPRGGVRRSAQSNQSSDLWASNQPVTNNYHRAGGQQNVGNFITGRATSRVLAPPGGGSSLSLS